jgi:hypothetical protein
MGSSSSSAGQEIPPHIMVPGVSLPYAQDPVIYPYLEPDKSSSHCPILFL